MATVTDSLGVGSSIGGYVVTGAVGQGPAGTVYLAEHPSLRVPAALKVLSPDLAGSAGFRERFLHDCRIAAAVDHPAAIPILEADFADELLFVARKHVDGTDLATILRDGPLSSDQALTIIEQVAGALHAAHCEGLVHRDLKPSNILLESDTRRVYVTDFGMAPTVMDFAAPEQAMLRRVDGRADVYSLGRVLVTCLPAVPPRLQPVVSRALAMEPAERYSTAIEFADACRAGLPSVRRPEATAEAPVDAPPERPRRRWRYVVAAAAIAVAAAVVGILTVMGGSDRNAATAASPMPPVRPLIAARLRDRLVPRQQALTERVQTATTGTLKGVEAAALAVGDEVGNTEGWVATLRPATAADRVVIGTFIRALSAQGVYAASLGNLAPASSITRDQAKTVVANATRAEAAYRRLHLAAPHFPSMPLRRADQLRLLALTPAQAPVYDEVAFSGGDGVRYRNSPALWCGGAPLDDPCWKSVLPGTGAAEGQRLRIYCYTHGAAVHGDPWWAEVRQNPAEYVPATFLRTAHDAAPTNGPLC